MTAPVKDSSGKRVWYLDWLRVFACLSVVLIHCLTTYMDNVSMSELGVGRAVAWTELHVMLTRWAVPAFFIITGAILLDPQKEVGWRKVGGYALRMFGVLLSFGTLFSLMELVFVAGGVHLEMIPQAVANVLQGRSWAHLWYLYDLIGIYLLLPLLRGFVSSSERKGMETLLAILFAFSVVLPTINDAFGLSLETFVWLGFPVFYVLLGWYLRKYEVPLLETVALGAAGLVSSALLAWGGGRLER